jgi:hypothetical protein
MRRDSATESRSNWSWLGASANWFASSDALSPTSTTRLDFTSHCNVDAPRPSTLTTRFNFGLCRNVRAQQRRVRLFRLHEDDRQPADDYFNYSSRLES